MVSKVIKGKDIDSVISGKLIFLMKMHKINGVANIVYKNEHLGDKNTGPFLSTETRILGHSFPIIFLIAFHYGNQSHYFFNRNLNMLGYWKNAVDLIWSKQWWTMRTMMG